MRNRFIKAKSRIVSFFSGFKRMGIDIFNTILTSLWNNEPVIGKRTMEPLTYMMHINLINHYLEISDNEKMGILATINYYQKIFNNDLKKEKQSKQFFKMAKFNLNNIESYRYFLSAFLVISTTRDEPYAKEHLLRTFEKVFGKTFRKSIQTFKTNVFDYWSLMNYVPIHTLIAEV